MATEMAVGVAKVSDASDLAALHRDALSVGLLARCPEFTLRGYHHRLIRSSATVSVVARDAQGRVIGFCHVTNRRLAPRTSPSPTLLLGIAIGLFRNPSYIGVLIHQAAGKIGGSSSGDWEIEAFAVEGRSRGRGVGSVLIHRALAECAASSPIQVTTRTHNARLASYYIRAFGASVTSKSQLEAYDEYGVSFVWPSNDETTPSEN